MISLSDHCGSVNDSNDINWKSIATLNNPWPAQLLKGRWSSLRRRCNAPGIFHEQLQFCKKNADKIFLNWCPGWLTPGE